MHFLELSPRQQTLSTIRSLFLDQNGLSNIPPTIALLRNLEEATFSSNRLVKIADEIGKLRKLRRLELDNNPTLRKCAKTAAIV